MNPTPASTIIKIFNWWARHPFKIDFTMNTDGTILSYICLPTNYMNINLYSIWISHDRDKKETCFLRHQGHPSSSFSFLFLIMDGHSTDKVLAPHHIYNSASVLFHISWRWKLELFHTFLFPIFSFNPIGLSGTITLPFQVLYVLDETKIGFCQRKKKLSEYVLGICI